MAAATTRRAGRASAACCGATRRRRRQMEKSVAIGRRSGIAILLCRALAVGMGDFFFGAKPVLLGGAVVTAARFVELIGPEANFFLAGDHRAWREGRDRGGRFGVFSGCLFPAGGRFGTCHWELLLKRILICEPQWFRSRGGYGWLVF